MDMREKIRRVMLGITELNQRVDQADRYEYPEQELEAFAGIAEGRLPDGGTIFASFPSSIRMQWSSDACFVSFVANIAEFTGRLVWVNIESNASGKRAYADLNATEWADDVTRVVAQMQ